MNIILAKHHGMCFGVRDALRATHDAAKRQPVTILGQLVHNPLVDRHLSAVGARQGNLNDLSSAGVRFNDLNTTHSSLEEIFVSLVHQQ